MYYFQFKYLPLHMAARRRSLLTIQHLSDILQHKRLSTRRNAATADSDWNCENIDNSRSSLICAALRWRACANATPMTNKAAMDKSVSASVYLLSKVTSCGTKEEDTLKQNAFACRRRGVKKWDICESCDTLRHMKPHKRAH